MRKLVRERAQDRCEYCRLPQDGYELTFHVEHIVASQHQQDDNPSNLALACNKCNLHKGTNLVTIDEETDERVDLFNPRTVSWDDHFQFIGAEIVGRTPTGRATARLLQMNTDRRLLLRKRLMSEGMM
ncbi:MAG: HNH endonuclease, partial [Planctomycetaceae bacterium]